MSFQTLFLVKLLVLLFALTVLNASQYSSLLSPNSKSFTIEPRVIGGRESTPHSAPYMVSIQQEPGSSSRIGTHFCGGVIIHENWVLTAAHCLPSENVAKHSIIVAGAHNIETVEQTRQTRRIDFYKNHELYTGGTAPYDLALVYTKEKFQLNSNVKKVSLPKKDAVPTGKATLLGWGSISMTQKPLYPSKLHSVEIPIIDRAECKRVLGSMGIYVHETNICTGPLSGGRGICQADSGGPLVQKDVVIGVVSWGKTPCGQANSPSVFVRVSAFVDWILNVQKHGPK